MSNFVRNLATLVLCSLAPILVASPPSYRIREIDLPTELNGESTYLTTINNRGAFTVSSVNSYRLFRYDQNQFVGEVMPISAGNRMFASAMNVQGTICGIETSQDNQYRIAVSASHLITSQVWTDKSWARGLNNSGTYAGSFYSAGSSPRPALFENGTMRELYNPLDYGEAMGINDHGLAIGYMYRKGDYMFYPIAWRNGEYIEIINQPKIFGGLAAVNNNDQILGWEYYTNDLGKKVYAPAIWKDGEITRFPTIHSQQYWDLTGGFNNNGDILFSAYEGDMFGHRWNEEYYAVLGGTTYKFDDLLENKQAGLQYNAYRINDAGVIGGWTFDPQTGKTRAVLFSPVPEPLSLATLGLGLAICVGRRKTR